MNEKEVREHIKKLRHFYTNVVIYLGVNFFLILVWLLSGVGYFWPIWVIIGWGIGLALLALSLGLIPQMTAILPFMTTEWEDEEVRRMMEAKTGNCDDSAECQPEPKKEPAKKATVSKKPAKKSVKTSGKT